MECAYQCRACGAPARVELQGGITMSCAHEARVFAYCAATVTADGVVGESSLVERCRAWLKQVGLLP